MRRFPENFRRMTYLEVFGGGASVLFNKPRSAKEILNDYNSQLINLYRHVREHPEELKDRLRFVLNCREDFKLTYQRLRRNEYTDLLQKAADTYQVLHQSYGGHGKNFAGNPRGMWSTFPTITEACGRLQRVIIENWDFEKVFLTYDSLGTFSYFDPPYFTTERYYEGFTPSDHERLANLLFHSSGLWLLSYNDCPEIIDIYRKPGIYIERVSRINNLAQRFSPGAEYRELLISNYDTSNPEPEQLSMFDGSIILSGKRNYLWH